MLKNSGMNNNHWNQKFTKVHLIKSESMVTGYPIGIRIELAIIDPIWYQNTYQIELWLFDYSFICLLYHCKISSVITNHANPFTIENPQRNAKQWKPKITYIKAFQDIFLYSYYWSN